MEIHTRPCPCPCPGLPLPIFPTLHLIIHLSPLHQLRMNNIPRMNNADRTKMSAIRFPPCFPAASQNNRTQKEEAT